MTTKHTPGPWSYSTHSEGWCFSINIFQSDKAPYTPNWSDVAFCTCTGEVKDIQEANARLIAAAPELLDALQAIANGVEGSTCSRLSDQQMAEIARAAIAKATGADK